MNFTFHNTPLLKYDLINTLIKIEKKVSRKRSLIGHLLKMYPLKSHTQRTLENLHVDCKV